MAGCSPEEKTYRRFLELFLGEFRGPCGGGEPQPEPEPEESEPEPEPELVAAEAREASVEEAGEAAAAAAGEEAAARGQSAVPPPQPRLPPLPPLPRPLSERITREEVEGESLDLCLQQLYK